MNIKTAQKQAHSKKAMNNKNRDECLPQTRILQFIGNEGLTVSYGKIAFHIKKI